MERKSRDAVDALREFQQRMVELHAEVDDIQHVLARPDLVVLAQRTRELIRRTKGLLDGNTAVLFPHDPPRVSEELYDHIEFARAQLNRALRDEHDFEAIQQRLHMATSLCAFVIARVSAAVEKLLVDEAASQ